MKTATKNKVQITQTLDILTGVKHPTAFPWPFENNSITEITCAGVFEFIPGKLRGKFMDEVYRVLVDGGIATFNIPYWNSSMGIHDFRYEWPPVSAQSFMLFNKEWRSANKKDLKLVSDFDFTYGFFYEPETAARNLETQLFHAKHYSDTVQAIQLVLNKRPPTK